MILYQCELDNVGFIFYAAAGTFLFALQELRHPGHGRENPVNSLTIRKSKFGLVGYTTITIDTLKNKNYRLQKVPSRSPLDDGLEMRLNVYSESRVFFLF